MTANEAYISTRDDQFYRAREALRSGYVAAGFTVDGQPDDSLTLRYNQQHFAITPEDIQEYAAGEALREAGETLPVECSLVSANYREHVVQPLDPIRWRYLPPLELGYVFGEPDDSALYATIGAATTDFVNFFRFDPAYIQICLERMSRVPVDGPALDIRHGFYRPPTIRIYNLGESALSAALRRSSELIEYCLFEVSYLKRLPVGLAQEWPARRRLEDDSFKFGEEFAGNVLPLPPAEFNADVIQFYQMGVSTRIPVLQFWSFYQVLEYFFIRASDQHLHRQLANRLKDPRFRPSPAQLDRLVQDVIDHLDLVDEIQMVKNVLDRYVDDDELIAFIEGYEAYRGEELYTRRRRLFGEDIQVRLVPGAVTEGVARTIMAIRQTLIFSSDRFSRTARGISFEQVTESIRPEIPLMKFLAERVIIGSAS
jgi:hypothetical protein